MIPNKLGKSIYHNTAIEMADLVVEKQEAYGDSFGKSGQVLKQLYPNGIKVDQYDDMLTLVRIIDKLFRVATKKDAFGESPFKDILGYALLAATKDRINQIHLHMALNTTSLARRLAMVARSSPKATQPSLKKKRPLK